MSIYDQDLDQNQANFAALSPISFLRRAAAVYPDRPAVVYGERRVTWLQVWQRSLAMAQALKARGVQKGDTVAVLSANLPEMFEAHFAVPMCGAVLNAINMRLDAATVGFILGHGEAYAFIVDKEFGPVAKEALEALDEGHKPILIHIDDDQCEGGELDWQPEL